MVTGATSFRQKHFRNLPRMLVELTDEQRRIVQWGVEGSGPCLVKGGPGTGKTLVALYRVQYVQNQLRKRGVEKPRILFVTRNAVLQRAATQMLSELMGGNLAENIEVRIVDGVVAMVFRQVGAQLRIISDRGFSELVKEARERVLREGNEILQQATEKALKNISPTYLEEEIRKVIIAREVYDQEKYRELERTGRKVALQRNQRTAIWRVYEVLRKLQEPVDRLTWEQARSMAHQFVSLEEVELSYDAVIIDEAQDIDPSAIKLLFSLCRRPGCFFMAADVNQAIQGNGFRWRDIFEDLNFKSYYRTLKQSFRTTRQIAEAALSYLGSGALDEDYAGLEYTLQGDAPLARTFWSEEEESRLLASYFKWYCQKYEVPLDNCAVFCPTVESCKKVVKQLESRGIQATFTPNFQFNLENPGVKVLTFQSCKGLEFEIVAVAGLDNPYYSKLQKILQEEEKAEVLAREKRALYVAMTRARQMLLVLVPKPHPHPLFKNFPEELWRRFREEEQDFDIS